VSPHFYRSQHHISKTVRSLCGAVSFCVTKGYVCGDRCYVIAMARTAPQQSDGFADAGLMEGTKADVDATHAAALPQAPNQTP